MSDSQAGSPALSIDTELPAAAVPESEETDSSEETSPEAEALAAKEAEAQAKAAAVASKRKLQARVNGKVMDVEIDTSDDKELLKYVQKAIAADEKFEEASMTKKQMQNLIHALQTDPLSVLSNPALGLNIKELAEKVLLAEIEEQEKSPEQRELEKLRRELEMERKAKDDIEKERQEAQLESLRQEAFQQIDDEISDALGSSSLPKSPYVVKRITETLIQAINAGYDVGVKDIMPYVEEQITGEIQRMFEAAPEDVMEKIIGSNNLTRMRKSRLAKGKAAQKVVDPAKAIKETGKTAEVKAENKEQSKEDKTTFKKMFGSF